MTEFHFQKWQATGNDFVIVDNRMQQLSYYSTDFVKQICDRKFGVGADGFMLLETSDKYDFEMKYFNADGIEAEMCGNGGRSIIGFAHNLGLIDEETCFMASDGLHDGAILGLNIFRLKMRNVEKITRTEAGIFLNTGVPHLVIYTNDLDHEDIYHHGREFRYSKEFAPAGTNVNFVQFDDGRLRMRTYERGVESETLSCGTGAVAATLATAFLHPSDRNIYQVEVPGGSLTVSFKQISKPIFHDIHLEGEAKMVFNGSMKIN